MPPPQPLSRQDAFARHGFEEGYPLWNPTPVLLPRRRQTNGLKIGDVGVIDRDGCFNSLFNICNPPDPALELEHGFPSGFIRIKKPIIIDYNTFPSGHVFSSPETSWIPRLVETPYWVDGGTVDVSRVTTQYTANLSEDGAHIIVPQGAGSSKLALQDHHLFQSRANIHWSTWFSFVGNKLQGPLNSVHLITGLCRTRSWSLASFNKKDGREVPVLCELVEQDQKLQVDASRWTPLGRFARGIGPSIGSQEHINQTVFIQSFTITSNGIVKHPNQEQLAISNPLDTVQSDESADRETTTQPSDQARPAQQGNGSNGGATTAGTTLAHANNAATIQHIPEATLASHPSEVINRYLLTRQPSAEAAVTHDSIWITMLARGQLSKLQDLENALDAIVLEHYSIVVRDGVVYLRNKDISLSRFGVDRSELPIDLTDFVRQDDEEPYSRRPFWTVYRGSLQTPHGSPIRVAIKVITIEPTNGSSLSERETKLQRVIEEIATFDHINILPLIWTTIKPGRFTMVSPWAEKGTLTSYIDDMHDRLTDVEILTLIHDVAAGLHYLHSKDILHGNLSGSGIVIDANGTALLSDFALSILVDEHGSPLFGQSGPELGMMRWTAPESLTGENDNPTRNVPTKGSDIYSFGGIMLQILSGRVPYCYYEHEEDVMSAISRGETPKRPNDHRVTDPRWMFIQECWSSSNTVDMSTLSEDIIEFAKNDLRLAIESHQGIDERVDDSIVTPGGASGQSASGDDNGFGVPITDQTSLKWTASNSKYSLEHYAEAPHLASQLRALDRDEDIVFDLEALDSPPPPQLLREWAELNLTDSTWRDALIGALHEFSVPRSTIYRVICDHLEMTNRITDAIECFYQMNRELAGETKKNSELAAWVIDFKRRCARKLEYLGDIAAEAQQHDEAITRYSTALSLDPVIPQYIFMKRSKVYMAKRSWGAAIDDANEAIDFDPSSPWGYGRKREALHWIGRYDDAIDTFETMLLKISQSPHPEIRERRREYVTPEQTKAAIRMAIENAIRKSPLMLLNTHSGRLLEKSEQARSFESQQIFRELISSMTTHIDHAHIEREVTEYYRYATFSHTWEDNEPLFEDVIRIVVYDLDESLTHDKLQMFCKIVRDFGLHWAWSDTCCINKGDHFALQEALVSMFKWYEGSALTVVLLCDVCSPSRRGDLVRSIWNTRAWAFQEYHASKVVRFYTEDWKPYLNLDILNHKESPEIIAEMEEATGVSAQALMALRPGLDDIREKLRLASTRQTTLVEDAAYSLLGIFSMSLPVVYGEGDKALGRFLAQLLTSSGDTSILAWTGRSGSFNSCLPENIVVFNRLPTTHIPPVLQHAEMNGIIARLWNSSLNFTSIVRLYDRLHELPVPLFVGQRMKLPCLNLKLGPLSASWSTSGRTFRAQTAVGVVEIKTEEDLSRFGALYLVHPWIDFLLDRQPVGSVMETIPEGNTDDRYSLIGRLPSFPAAPHIRTGQFVARSKRSLSSRTTAFARDAASLRPPSSLSQTDKLLRAFQAIARLSQPFGALLLTPNLLNVAAYRRVAAESLITVQVDEITPTMLDKLVDTVRTLDVL